MSNCPCTLRIASLHGKSQLVKWNVLAQGKSRTECHRHIDAVVSEIVAGRAPTIPVEQLAVDRFA